MSAGSLEHAVENAVIVAGNVCRKARELAHKFPSVERAQLAETHAQRIKEILETAHDLCSTLRKMTDEAEQSSERVCAQVGTQLFNLHNPQEFQDLVKAREDSGKFPPRYDYIMVSEWREDGTVKRARRIPAGNEAVNKELAKL